MKWVAAGAIGVAVVPVLLIGILVGALFLTSGTSCAAASSVATESGCPSGNPVAQFDGAEGYVSDPTTGGFITMRMLHVYEEVAHAFDWTWGISCWDEHAWNPTSDHPLGRACDFTVGRLGSFPDEAARQRGWKLAEWLRDDAAELGVSYVIFDRKIWSAARSSEGWRTYGGGGVYDPNDATGGHYDHVHVSVGS